MIEQFQIRISRSENLLVNSYNENVRQVRRVRNMETLGNKLLVSKVTSKGQITIPKEVRDKLKENTWAKV